MAEATMRARNLVALAGFCWLAAASAAFAGSAAADFQSALSAAEAAEKDAGALKNQWTTTEEVLTAAKKAAAAGDFDTATGLANHAEALAKASIAQAKEQQDAWRAAIIR
jgi:hypothetical protein